MHDFFFPQSLDQDIHCFLFEVRDTLELGERLDDVRVYLTLAPLGLHLSEPLMLQRISTCVPLLFINCQQLPNQILRAFTNDFELILIKLQVSLLYLLKHLFLVLPIER